MPFLLKRNRYSKTLLRVTKYPYCDITELFKHLNPKVDYIAGGATQNTIRVAQWILGKKSLCSYMGCVGRDDSSKILEEKAREAGVNVKYQYSDKPTGRCAVLITGQDRSLVTKLDAANHFTVSHLEDVDNWKLVTSAKCVYSAGFFLTVSVESMLKVAKYCSQNNRTYCLNLSAPFLCQFFKDQMFSVLPFTDIVFGNETEAATYAEVRRKQLWSLFRASPVTSRLSQQSWIH